MLNAFLRILQRFSSFSHVPTYVNSFYLLDDVNVSFLFSSLLFLLIGFVSYFFVYFFRSFSPAHHCVFLMVFCVQAPRQNTKRIYEEKSDSATCDSHRFCGAAAPQADFARSPLPGKWRKVEEPQEDEEENGGKLKKYEQEEVAEEEEEEKQEEDEEEEVDDEEKEQLAERKEEMEGKH